MHDPGLLVLDVDGVMTDGTKTYGINGEVLSKRFCDHDFTAIKKFKMRGWDVCWLSADKTVNEAVAKDRGIDFWYSRAPDGTIDKAAWLDKLIHHYKKDPRTIIYVGDDIFDLPAMGKAISSGGRAFCPFNAARLVKITLQQHVAGGVLNASGGSGAIMELYLDVYKDELKAGFGVELPCS